MLDRATFCFPDSAYNPTHFATARRFDLFQALEGSSGSNRGWSEGDDPLDRYFEAQVHGKVLIPDDLEALVLDPCYRDTLFERQAARLGLPIEWHEGRVLPTSTLEEHSNYRGPKAVRLGHKIARNGCIDALIIGDAVRSRKYPTQALKQLWHLTAQWGNPSSN